MWCHTGGNTLLSYGQSQAGWTCFRASPVPHCGRTSGCGSLAFRRFPCFVSGLVVFVGVLVWVAALVPPAAGLQQHHDCLGKAPCPGVAVRRQARL